jgi:hypothetical protein
MTRKKTSPPVKVPGEIDLSKISLAEIRRTVTRQVSGPHMAATRVILASENKSRYEEDIDFVELGSCLQDQIKAVNQGDMSHVEAMLIAQATALQSLFARLAERGMGCDQIPGFEANMRMALRAQNQCRTTLETLAGIKNPPVVYARQANVTTGPQQINNGVAAPSQVREIVIDQTQLSEGNYELLPDTRASQAEGRVNQAVAPVGKIDRAKIRRG